VACFSVVNSRCGGGPSRGSGGGGGRSLEPSSGLSKASLGLMEMSGSDSMNSGTGGGELEAVIAIDQGKDSSATGRTAAPKHGSFLITHEARPSKTTSEAASRAAARGEAGGERPRCPAGSEPERDGRRRPSGEASRRRLPDQCI
jgi:hypothetical protein